MVHLKAQWFDPLMVVAHHGDPKHDVFINEAVEILIQKEESRTNKGCVRKMKLTLGHVGHL